MHQMKVACINSQPVNVPKKYLSLSRLFPLSERKHSTPPLPASTNRSSPPPPLNPVQRKHIRISIHLLQEIQRVPCASADVLTRPHAEIHPVGPVGLQLRGIHDGAEFGRRDYLRVVCKGEERVVGCGLGLGELAGEAGYVEGEGGLTPWSPCAYVSADTMST